MKRFDVTFTASLTMSIEAHSAADAETAVRTWFSPDEPRDPLQGASVKRELLPPAPYVGEALVMVCKLDDDADVSVEQQGA